ncbi:vWA domain-containing protein [Lapillicoccus sp.]|uniref:vWA domain-containing protein n=1 Tax=Lapillicoccus sp. TaxID=1909287 RepID=UPI0039834364
MAGSGSGGHGGGGQRGGGHRGGRYRYGSWDGGADPLAPPFDVRAAMDEIGKDVLSGSSLRDALERLMRRGLGDRSGLDALRREVARRRREVERRGDLAGTMSQVREELDRALDAEREFLAGREGDEARLAEMTLDALPGETAGAVRELADYQWASAEGQEHYANVLRMLREDVLDAQFAGMKQALSGQDPAAMEAVREMMADLNALLASHARGEDTSEAFGQFMDKHGEFFPEQPATVDELIDALARRQAAAQRMMSSLSSQQRDELAQLMAQAMQDVGLESEMSQLGDNLRALRPGMFRGRQRADIDGSQSLGFSDAVGAVADLADLEALEQQLSQGYPGATLDDVDVEALERQLPAASVRDLAALRDLTAELERQGYVQSGQDGLALTPKALRRLGETALKRIFRHLDAAAAGSHQDPASGAAEERTGAFLPWRFGDERPIDAVRTVQNAVLRTATTSTPRGGGGDADPAARHTGAARRPALTLDLEDFAVAETTRRTGAAVALCVDLSFSMIQEDRWGPMKQTALALAHLVSTRFRQDALQIIGFNRVARPLTAMQLAEVEPEWIQGTNLHHALILAGHHLRRHPDAEPVVLVVTDGEPTAHLEEDGMPTFDWPATPATVRATVGEVDVMTRYGVALNFFLLGDDPGLARFVDSVARRNGGRVFTPELGQLGEFVVADYLRARRGRRRSA